MTRQELETKWPRAQYEELKERHHFHSRSTYEKYLDMRNEQEEIAEEGRRLGLTGDEPPELTEEDIAIFDQIWAELGREAELKRRMETAGENGRLGRAGELMDEEHLVLDRSQVREERAA